MANTVVNVEVFQAGVEGKLGTKRKLSQFVETEVVEGLQAHTVNVVTNDYVGDAVVVPAGDKIPVTDLKQTKVPVTFEKIAKGVRVTDEELNQAFGDALGNAENQTVVAIDSAMEAKVATAIAGAKLTSEYTKVDGFTTKAILTAMGAFGENLENDENYLVVNPVDYANLQDSIKASDKAVLNETIYGLNLVMSSRVKAGEAIIIQNGALKELVQKETDVEVARDASTKSTSIFTDKIYGVYIQDQSKLMIIKSK